MELSPQRKPWGKGRQCFCKALAAARGDEDRLESSWGSIQIPDYAKIGALCCRELAARCVLDEPRKVGRLFRKSGNKFVQISEPELFETLLRDFLFSNRTRCLEPRHDSGTWQRISANVSGGSSPNVDQIVERLRRPAFARTHLRVILALQATKSWDVENLSSSGFVFLVVNVGSPLWPCQIEFVTNRTHGNPKKVARQCSLDR